MAGAFLLLTLARTLSGEPAAGLPPANDGKAPPKPSAVRRDSLPSALRKPSPTSVDDLRAMEKHMRELIAKVSPAVVAVRVHNATGSGVVISQSGFVLCAAHVCESPNQEVEFTFQDGSKAKGKTLGTNHEEDAGLMKITDPGKWAFANVGDLKESLLGDWVVALGHPGGFDLQRSKVARLGRIIALEADVLQSDCTLVGGDSGGPLFDMHGRVVGIHSRISDSTSANFHVPITCFVRDWEKLFEAVSWGNEGPPARPYTGARGVSSAAGFTIDRVDVNSPAEKAGLKVGDVVIRLNGAAVVVDTAYADFVSNAKPGDSMKLRIRRDAQELDLNIVVGTRQVGR